MLKFFSSAFLFFLFASSLLAQTKVENVKEICTGLQKSEKPLVAVMPFEVSVQGTGSAVGTGLPDMLMNALLNTGCFRVVERARLNDIMKEQNLGISGAGDESSFASVGKLMGAQIMVFGTITEFNENVGGGGVGGILRRVPGVGGIGYRKSHIGYTLRFVDPSTGELLASKAFNKEKTAVGAAGGGLFSGGIAGGGFYSSKSMQQAVDESLIEATEYMSQNKSSYMSAVGNNNNSTSTTSSNSTSSTINKSNCALLNAAKKPKVMVIIPEEHVTGAGSHYDPARYSRISIDINMYRPNNFSQYEAMPPTQAGETEIARKLLEAGFSLVDERQFTKLKDDKTLQDAFDNPSDASKVAARFGADILIVGEAFSEYSHNQNNMSSCRARIEVKAVMAGNAEMLATNSFNGSGLDATEIIAGKDAIAKAGTKIADYFIAQLCSKSDDIIAQMGKQKSKGGGEGNTETDIQFNNIDYSTASTVADIMKSAKGVTNVEKLSFSNKVAKFKVMHSGDTDSFIQSIVKNKMNVNLDVVSVEENFANIDVK